MRKATYILFLGLVYCAGALAQTAGGASVWHSMAAPDEKSAASSKSERRSEPVPSGFVEGYDSQGNLRRQPASEGLMAGNVNERARLRLYLGGRDEEELKVQAALATPSRTLDGVDPTDASEVIESPVEEKPE